RAMDGPAWATDSRFATNEARLANQAGLGARIETWTSELDDYEAMEILQAAGVPAGVCQKASDRFERDPQLAARDWWHSLPHAELGPCDFDGVVPRLASTPGQLRTASPILGEHTHEVLRDVLGFSDEQIAENEAAGVFM